MIHRFDNGDDEIINKKATLRKYEESDLFYNNTLNFNKYYGMNRFNSLPFDKKYNNLVIFRQDLN